MGRDTQKRRYTANKARWGESCKKMGNQSNARPVAYTRSHDRQLITEADAFLWLSKEDRKAETENQVTATQDQVFHAKVM